MTDSTSYSSRSLENVWRTLTTLPSAVLTLALVGVILLVACGNAPQTGVSTPPSLVSTASAPSPRASSPTPAAAFTPSAPGDTLPVATPSATSPPAVTSTPTVPGEMMARQLRVFTDLWEVVRDVYVYPDFNGLDWDAVHRRYRAQIEAGMDDEGFYQAMREMIDELGDDHSGFYSPEEVAEEEAWLNGESDYVGIGVYVMTLPDKGYAVLLQVFPDSPAEQAGLLRHDRILAIDGVPVVGEHGEDRLDLLGGRSGSEVRLTVQTPGQESRELVMTREHVQAEFQVEAYRMPGTDIGYLMIPTFWELTISSRVRQALERLMAEGELAGLIVDMRINDGGWSTTAQDTMSIFTDGTLGAFVSRDAERPLIVAADPVGNSQKLPLVILVGRETESFGEIFSGVLQESKRARVVGRTTDGNVEVLWDMDFEDGSRVWIAVETFRPLSGADWEKSGIIPDFEIAVDWDEFTAETDQQLRTAVDWLLQSTTEAPH